jgi:hypothetical protein
VVSLRHRLPLVLACTLLLAAAAVPAAAVAQDVYGHIRGTVTDTLGPMPGARVTLVGTAFVATTDLLGAYAIENVPAGEYTARVETALRSPMERSSVRVASGATVILDVRLGHGGIVVRPAGDELASRTQLSGTLLSRLPIDDSRQGLSLASGVVLRGTDLGVAGTPDLTIRGSGADQTAVFVDGAPARFETAGMGQLALGGHAISEVSVETGAPSATVADARGATIAYVTRAGGPRFESGLLAGTDGPFSKNSTAGYNRFDGFAGGPMPGVRNLTWFVSAALYGQSSAYRGAGADTVPTFGLAGVDTTVSFTNNGNTYTVAVPRFAQVSGTCGQLGSGDSTQARQIRANYGLACQGLRLNLDWTTSRRAQTKLLYTYGRGSSLSLTGLASDFQQRDNPGADMADNLLYTGTRAHSALAVLNWTQRLTEPLGGALTLRGNLSLGSEGYQSGPLDLTSEQATRDPTGGIEFSMLRFAGLEGLPLPLTDAVIREMRTGTFRAPYQGRNDLAPRQDHRLNPYGVASGWPTTGFGGLAMVASETRVNGRLAADWRATPSVTLTLGGDFSRTEVSFYEAGIVTGLGFDAFLAHPRRTGLFAEARLDAGPLELDAGVRGDRYVTGADFPKVPGRIFSNPAVRTGDTSYAARMSRVLDPGRTQILATPRVRVRYRVAAHTTMRAGFSQQVEVPAFSALFAGVNSDMYNSSNVLFGRDVSYVKSTLVEAGVRQGLPMGITLDVAAYSKSNPAPYLWQGQSIYDPFIGGDPGQPNSAVVELSTLARNSVIGADGRLEVSTDGAVQGALSYSIMQSHVRLRYSAVTPPAIRAQPSDVTTQVITGTLLLRVPEEWGRGSALGVAARGLGAALALRATSGQPYTPLANEGSGAIAPYGALSGTPLGQEWSARLPWTWTLDLRLSKVVRAGGIRWTLYAEARNLLNISNVVAAFAETGNDRNDLFRANLLLPQISSLQADAGALWVTRQVTINGVPQSVQGVDLSDCSRYPTTFGVDRGVVDCVALRQVEARWGNGDRFYDTNEINRALGAWFDAFYGTWRFHGPARTARVGITIEF